MTYKQKFDFDRFGNLYRKTASNPTSGQETPLLYTPIEDADIDRTTNRFTTATGTTYNEAGQVVTDNKFRTMSFGYDANGRMVKATKTSVPDALTIYDASGNRVATKIDDIWQFTIYDAFGKLVAEYGGLTPSDEGGVKYVLEDWQGSVRTIINNAGFVQSRTDYTTFGEEINSGVGLRTASQGFGGGINTRQGYGLTERDDSTGLNHTWYRKNENQAGRWTSPDPDNESASIEDPQSWNRYSYVENEPTNFVDPSGLLMIDYSSCRTVATITINFDLPSQQTFEIQVCNVIKTNNQGDGLIEGAGINPVDLLLWIIVNSGWCILALFWTVWAWNCMRGRNPGIQCKAIVERAIMYGYLCLGRFPPGLPEPPKDPNDPEPPKDPSKPPTKPKPKPKPKPKSSRTTQKRLNSVNTVRRNVPRKKSRRRTNSGLGPWRPPWRPGPIPWSGFGGGGDADGGGAGGSWDD